jgi:hypothetical protein
VAPNDSAKIATEQRAKRCLFISSPSTNLEDGILPLGHRVLVAGYVPVSRAARVVDPIVLEKT